MSDAGVVHLAVAGGPAPEDSRAQEVQTSMDAPMSSEDIADLMEVITAAGERLHAVLDGVMAGRYPVSSATVRDFEQLLEQMRPAAACRARLNGLEVSALLKGAETWVLRRQQQTRLHLIEGAG